MYTHLELICTTTRWALGACAEASSYGSCSFDVASAPWVVPPRIDDVSSSSSAAVEPTVVLPAVVMAPIVAFLVVPPIITREWNPLWFSLSGLLVIGAIDWLLQRAFLVSRLYVHRQALLAAMVIEVSYDSEEEEEEEDEEMEDLEEDPEEIVSEE